MNATELLTLLNVNHDDSSSKMSDLSLSVGERMFESGRYVAYGAMIRLFQEFLSSNGYLSTVE